jgi:hypothetical protein
MLSSLFLPVLRKHFRRLGAAQAMARDQRKRLLDDVVAVKGLMPLLMKPRNGEPWTPEERERLRVCLKHLSVASPYLVAPIMPGGIFFLPALAWWLDRRRRRHKRDRQAAAARRPVP